MRLNLKTENQSTPKNRGAVLIMTLVFATIFVFIAGGLLSLVNQQKKLNLQKKSQAQALQIAEAGANYYRWHLAHAVEDYADGTGQTGCNPCGPFVHSYYDPNGGLLGYFELIITPPDPSYPGSRVGKVKSTDWTTDQAHT